MKIKTEGFYQLHRDIQKIEWLFNDPRPFRKSEAWIFLLMNAEYQESKRKGRFHDVQIHNGEIFFSEQELADIWHWKKPTVHAFLQDLIKEEMIVKVSTEKENKNGSVYKILTYNGKKEECSNKDKNIEKLDAKKDSNEVSPAIKQDFTKISDKLFKTISKRNHSVKQKDFQSIEPLLDLFNSGVYLPYIVSVIDWLDSDSSDFNKTNFWHEKIKGTKHFYKFFQSMEEQFAYDEKTTVGRDFDEYRNRYKGYSEDLLLLCMEKYENKIENSVKLVEKYQLERELQMCKEELENRN